MVCGRWCAVTVRRIEPTQLPTHIRQVNRGLFDMFVDADRFQRGHLSARRSVVLYNGNGFFRYAISARPRRAMLAKLFTETSVRFWSKGI